MYRLYGYGFFSAMMFERVLWMVYLNSIGWSVLEIGVAQAILNFSQVLLEFPTGYIADRFGRKTSLILGQICIILYLSTYFFARYHYVFIFGFVLYGLGLSLISGADQSLLYEVSGGKNKYTKLMGRYNAIVICSIIISTNIAGILSSISWNLLFTLSIMAQIGSLLLLIFVNDHAEKYKENNQNSSIIKDLKSFFVINKKFKYLVLTVVVLQATFSILYQYAAILLHDYSFSNNSISIIFTLGYLLSIAASINLYKLTEKFDKQNLVSKILLFHLAIISILIIDAPFVIIIVILGNKLFYELWDTTLNTIIHDNINDNFRSSMVSVISLLTALLMGIESIFIGIMDRYLSLRMIFLVLGLISICVSYFLFQKTKEKMVIYEKKQGNII